MNKEPNLEEFIRQRQERLRGFPVQEPMPSPAAIAIAVLMVGIVIGAVIVGTWSAVDYWWLR